MTDIKTVTLMALQDSIKALEERVDKLGGKNKAAKIPAPAVTADIKDLLSQLDTAKEKEDKKAQFKIRRQLRKAGYSLRDNNGK